MMRYRIALFILLVCHNIKKVTPNSKTSKGKYNQAMSVLRGPPKGEPSKGGKRPGGNSDEEAGPSKKTKKCNICGTCDKDPCVCWKPSKEAIVYNMVFKITICKIF